MCWTWEVVTTLWGSSPARDCALLQLSMLFKISWEIHALLAEYTWPVMTLRNIIKPLRVGEALSHTLLDVRSIGIVCSLALPFEQMSNYLPFFNKECCRPSMFATLDSLYSDLQGFWPLLASAKPDFSEYKHFEWPGHLCRHIHMRQDTCPGDWAQLKLGQRSRPS